MEATKTNDFEVLYENAKTIGAEQVTRGYITQDDLEYRLAGMKAVYDRIVEAD